MALGRSQIGRKALNFLSKTRSSSLLNVDGCHSKHAVYVLSLSSDCWLGNCPVNRNNAGEVFNSQPSREVTAAVNPACYETTEEHRRSTRLTCRTKSRHSRMSCVKRMTHGEQYVSGNHWGPGQVLLVRAYSGRSGKPLYETQTGYYDVLGVSPSATHAQIKTAYYKQSFLYHPDKNAGSEGATLRFAEISEAYNVLGNQGLKKKYDRGILSQSDLVGSSRPSAKETSSSTSQPSKARLSVMGVNSKAIFDFDKFIKSHYGGQLQKQRDVQVRKEEMMRKKESNMQDWKLDNVLEISVGVLVVIAFSILFSLKK